MGSEGEHHPRFLQSRKWNARGGVAAHADAMHQDGPARLGDCEAKAELQAIAAIVRVQWFGGAPDDVELFVGQRDGIGDMAGPLRGLTRRLRLESLIVMVHP